MRELRARSPIPGQIRSAFDQGEEMALGQRLGYITPNRAYIHEGKLYTHAASGRIMEELSRHFDKVYLCTRAMDGPPPASTDRALEVTNVELIAQPFWVSSLGALRYFLPISRSYFQTCKRSTLLFVRGMCPYIPILYLFAFMFRRRVCHWIVGDPIALLRASSRSGRLIDALSLLYAWQDRAVTRIGRWLTKGAFICNGSELASAYRSPRTLATVSSTVKEDEFCPRTDTCCGATICIVCVAYIRPEKGIEYLLEAVGQIRITQPWELLLIGSDEFPEYRDRLEKLIADLGIGERVRWAGYVSYGEPIYRLMRSADLLVLPTLSEGTPHVLVEARANGLPCISTTVGGIPNTVADGFDALLVAPKDAPGLGRAIQQMVENGELRRAIIRNGLAAARAQTLEKFVAQVLSVLERNTVRSTKNSDPRVRSA